MAEFGGGQGLQHDAGPRRCALSLTLSLSLCLPSPPSVEPEHGTHHDAQPSFILGLFRVFNPTYNNFRHVAPQTTRRDRKEEIERGGGGERDKVLVVCDVRVPYRVHTHAAHTFRQRRRSAFASCHSLHHKAQYLLGTLRQFSLSRGVCMCIRVFQRDGALGRAGWVERSHTAVGSP